MAINFNKFTVKAQEAIQNAQQEAEKRGHTEITPEHLLFALIHQNEGLVRPILEKLGVNLSRLESLIETALGRKAQVSGGISQTSLSNELNQIFSIALKEAEKLR